MCVLKNTINYFALFVSIKFYLRESFLKIDFSNERILVLREADTLVFFLEYKRNERINFFHQEP